jgi:hypothetical protein
LAYRANPRAERQRTHKMQRTIRELIFCLSNIKCCQLSAKLRKLLTKNLTSFIILIYSPCRFGAGCEVANGGFCFLLDQVMKTNVYIDAFNLYYGCLRNSPYRWLNLESFAV